ncbi:MAG: copper amine oxidase N-terminal domain-containing protein [Fimbriimonadaceae bacterium]
MDSMPIYMNGEMVNFDVNPRVTNGVASLLRHLFEHNGGKVKWDHEKKMVQGLDEALSISFTIGDPTARVNGNSMLMEMAPFIERGRSIIPLSFFSQALNVDVQFDPATGHVLILNAKSK